MSAVLARLHQIGAHVFHVYLRVGYVDADIPKEQLTQLASLRGIEIAQPFYAYRYPDAPVTGMPDTLKPNVIRIPIPHVAHSIGSPPRFFPAADAGLLGVRRLKADGSGVRVGLVDSGIDELHPELRYVLDGKGKRIPKLASVALTGSYWDGYPGWVHAMRIVHAKAGRFSAYGHEWKAPRNALGWYGLGFFHQRLIFNSLSGDSVDLSAPVLMDFRTKTAWLDFDGDRDFSNDQPVSDYEIAGAIGTIGKVHDGRDDRIPYVLRFDTERDAVKIMISGDHGTLVAGTMAGNMLSGGLFDGAAPNARIVDVRGSSTNVGDMLEAIARPDVDLVSASGGFIDEFEVKVLARALAVYRKPLFCICPTIPGAISIGDYQSRRELRENRGLIGMPRDNVSGDAFPKFTTSGPLVNARGVYNYLRAPSTALTSNNRFSPLGFVKNTVVSASESKTLPMSPNLLFPAAPDGYVIGANPSPTISFASGAVANLIQLGRREHVAVDAGRLELALVLSARPLRPGTSMTPEAGVIDVTAAWHLLQRMNAIDMRDGNRSTFEIQQRREGRLTTIFGAYDVAENACLVHGGQVLLTRHGGPPESALYRLQLTGSPGFSLTPRIVSLRRNHPVAIRYAMPSHGGLATALVRVIDQRSGTPLFLFPLYSAAPDMPTRVGPYEERFTRVIPAHNMASLILKPKVGGRSIEIVSVAIPGTNIMPPAFSTTAGEPFEGPTFEGIGGSFYFKKFIRLDTWADGKGPDYGPLGTMRHYAIDVRSPVPKLLRLYSSNRADPEYESGAFPAAPRTPIQAHVIVKTYTADITRLGNTTTVRNAGATGMMRLIALASSSNTANATSHGGIARHDFVLKNAASEIKIRVAREVGSTFSYSLVACDAGRNECPIVATAKNGEELKAYDIVPGTYSVMVVGSKLDNNVKYDVAITTLGADPQPLEPWHNRASGETWNVATNGVESFIALQTAYAPDQQSGPWLEPIALR